MSAYLELSSLAEVEAILSKGLKPEIQTLETERMIIGYVYFRNEENKRVLGVHNLFIKKRFRGQGLAGKFIRESFRLDLFDARVSINVMNDRMLNLITREFGHRLTPITEFLNYEIRYPSFIYR